MSAVALYEPQTPCIPAANMRPRWQRFELLGRWSSRWMSKTPRRCLEKNTETIFDFRLIRKLTERRIAWWKGVCRFAQSVGVGAKTFASRCLPLCHSVSLGWCKIAHQCQIEATKVPGSALSKTQFWSYLRLGPRRQKWCIVIHGRSVTLRCRMHFSQRARNARFLILPNLGSRYPAGLQMPLPWPKSLRRTQ